MSVHPTICVHFGTGCHVWGGKATYLSNNLNVMVWYIIQVHRYSCSHWLANPDRKLRQIWTALQWVPRHIVVAAVQNYLTNMLPRQWYILTRLPSISRVLCLCMSDWSRRVTGTETYVTNGDTGDPSDLMGTNQNGCSYYSLLWMNWINILTVTKWWHTHPNWAWGGKRYMHALNTSTDCNCSYSPACIATLF